MIVPVPTTRAPSRSSNRCPATSGGSSATAQNEMLQKPDTRLGPWLRTFCNRIDLVPLLRRSETWPEDIETLDALLDSPDGDGDLDELTLEEFAGEGWVKGRVVITTLHSSKGRQFDAVVLPQLQEAILPYRRWNKRSRTYDEPSRASLIDDRRLFHVGLTRARQFVFLVYSDAYTNDYRYALPAERSRFVKEVERRLEE